MTGAAGMPEVFRECRLGKHFAAAVVKALDGDGEGVESMMRVRRVTEDMGRGNEAARAGDQDWYVRSPCPSARPLIQVCSYWGQLTDVGRVSTHALGTSLRALYVDKLGFLPSTLPNVRQEDSPVFFRSTAMPRTMESLFGIVGGLYPDGKREGGVDFTVRKPVDESLYPNSLCL